MQNKKDLDKLQDDIAKEYEKETLKMYRNLLLLLSPVLLHELKARKTIDKELKKISKKQVALMTTLLVVAGGAISKDKRLINKAIKQNWSGVKYSDRIYKEKKLLKKVLERELKNSIKNGEDKADIALRMSKKLDISINSAKRLIETETSQVINAVAIEKGKAKKHTKYKIIVTMDDRTSPICQEIHDKNETFNIGERKVPGKNWVPAHPYCRSRIKTF